MITVKVELGAAKQDQAGGKCPGGCKSDLEVWNEYKKITRLEHGEVIETRRQPVRNYVECPVHGS